MIAVGIVGSHVRGDDVPAFVDLRDVFVVRNVQLLRGEYLPVLWIRFV
jgi:hypothetical protein